MYWLRQVVQRGTDNISDVSDDGISTDGNTTDDPTDIILTYETGIEVVKTSTISDNGDDVNGLRRYHHLYNSSN